jgi:serine/threonine-protein kinase HipA
MTTSAASDVFVHARFPDGTTSVIGRCRFRDERLDRNLGEFQYAASWLRNAHGRSFPLDPVNLPLSPEAFFTTKRGGLFGVLADTTPDRWGLRLMRLTRQSPMSPRDLLLATGDERVGCLAFSQSPQPPPAAASFLPFVTLAQIADAFDRIVKGEDADPKFVALYRAGASLGGVRPKALVEHDGHLWIAKFQRHDDDIDQCAAEHASLRLVESVQAIAVAALGAIPTIENCMSRCGEFGLSQEAAKVVASAMVERMRDWRDVFRSLGVPAATIGRLEQVFAPVLAAEGA